MRERIAQLAKRSDRLRAAVQAGRRARSGLRDARGFGRYLRGGPISELSDRFAVRLAFNLLLEREPGEAGFAEFEGRLRVGQMTRAEMVAFIHDSKEFADTKAYRHMGSSVHRGRCVFVRSLPRARRILDLGGSSRGSEAGALVELGYPYAFDELVIVELPAEVRHDHYSDVVEADRVVTALGPVTYRYHSMTDLTGLEDGSFDLVYSGQSIEHVSVADADAALAEVRRVLRPGGFLALDTPNGAVCRLQQPGFIDPDHKVEYTHAELSAKLTAAGFAIVRRHGLNFAGASVETGVFDVGETARQWGLFDDIENSYILAYVCTPLP
jgi:SAM-dependent methyltransferase